MRKILLALMLVGALASAACTTEPATGRGEQAVSNSGNTEHPPADDVKVRGCAVDNSLGIDLATAKLAVTNHTSKTSDYTMLVEFVDKSGTRVGEAGASVSALAPGQVAKTNAVGDSAGETSLRCKVTHVERWAS